MSFRRRRKHIKQFTKKQEKIKTNNTQFVIPTKEETHKAIHKKNNVIPPTSERQKNKKSDFNSNTFPSRLPFLRKGLGIGISPSRLPFLRKGLGIGINFSSQNNRLSKLNVTFTKNTKRCIYRRNKIPLFL